MQAKNEVWAFSWEDQDPKQRLSEKFLNYSAPIITVWILPLKELSQPSQFHCPVDNPKNRMLSLFPCANKTTNVTVGICNMCSLWRDMPKTHWPWTKGTVIANFPEVTNGIFYNVTYFTNQCFPVWFFPQNKFYIFWKQARTFLKGFQEDFTEFGLHVAEKRRMGRDLSVWDNFSLFINPQQNSCR